MWKRAQFVNFLRNPCSTIMLTWELRPPGLVRFEAFTNNVIVAKNDVSLTLKTKASKFTDSTSRLMLNYSRKTLHSGNQYVPTQTSRGWLRLTQTRMPHQQSKWSLANTSDKIWWGMRHPLRKVLAHNSMKTLRMVPGWCIRLRSSWLGALGIWITALQRTISTSLGAQS